jgi:hypothetical protein
MSANRASLPAKLLNLTTVLPAETVDARSNFPWIAARTGTVRNEGVAEQIVALSFLEPTAKGEPSRALLWYRNPSALRAVRCAGVLAPR